MTAFTAKANGNLSTETQTGSGAQDISFTYDLRNRMTGQSVTAGGAVTNTAYTYDTSGVLASETTGSDATYYLNDPNNPTGYTKAISYSSTLDGIPVRSYVLGLNVIAQNDAANGTLYLVTDYHGSTRVLLDSSGNVVQSFDYDAFGTPLDFDPATADTVWLFGGDGFYDPASGWTYHLARWTNGFWFTQADSSGFGSNSDPITLNPYMYADGDPVNVSDPSGDFGVPDGWLSDGNGSAQVGALISGYEADVSALESVTETGASDYQQNQITGLISQDGVGLSTGNSDYWNDGMSALISDIELFFKKVVGNGINFNRTPDFCELSFSAGFILGYAAAFSDDCYGEEFIAPYGFSFGTPGLSWSLTIGWLNTPDRPTETQLNAFLSSWSLGAGGGDGPGLLRQWTPGAGSATSIGLFTPQVGYSWTCSYLWSKNGLKWGPNWPGGF